ncbi:AI-2E family transporter, partial [Paracoccus sp. PXZ]
MTTGEMPKPTTATELNDPAAPRQSPKQVGLRVHRPPLLTNISAARWLLLAIVAASIYFFHG